MTPLQRTVQLIVFLLGNPRARITAELIAGLLGTSKRTGYRYMKLLRDAGIVRGGGRTGVRLRWELARGRAWR